MGPLLEKDETKQELDLYVEQLHYRFQKQVKMIAAENASTGGWALVVNMDGWTFGKAFDFSGRIFKSSLNSLTKVSSKTFGCNFDCKLECALLIHSVGIFARQADSVYGSAEDF